MKAIRKGFSLIKRGLVVGKNNLAEEVGFAKKFQRAVRNTAIRRIENSK